ncbi:RrF2 family transcriptional regulator [Mycolicibacterium vaccae]|uniref:BadM/Rrf2 family transcriptional regulator n=1 Tax=Mycolicibacterium vaccae ATCC 25954 TaxID=1194972 RepID=K0VD77_MYCVA|nr:Rrf2 family transcriptional regulator [Mycolicibacterium vaccae]ANI39995.1 Rrf2 family transcriptional regulator [Mycolicibacterium vaccae 95051]EJZ09034.1 BadM/Rrf2 family transcriptional regulator [Mycolicibacterium vaccae ATCC 25954]MCV7063352.1 Rrf2 family transcriptional regulator [Mycolicibacterium vaccae]
MRISAKTDYALRALAHLAADWQVPHSSESIAADQHIPAKYLEAILSELNRTRFVVSQRGHGGGHRLRVAPDRIAVADIVRALNGPLLTVRGECPEDLDYGDRLEALQSVWVAARVSLRRVLERTTLADLVAGRLPDDIAELTREPGAWESRSAI